MTCRAYLLLAILGAGCGGSSPSGPASPEFQAVQAIFDAHCVGCHNTDSGGLTPAALRGYPALPLTAGKSHQALVNQPAHEVCGGTLVVPGDSANSYLQHKLVDPTPCEGGRMPIGEAIILQPLDSDQMATIDAWIAAGAPE